MADRQQGSVQDDHELAAASVPPCLKRMIPAWAKRWLARQYWRKYDTADWLAERIGCLPSHRLRRIGLCRLLGVRIGTGSSVHRGCRFYRPAGVVIGDHCVVNCGVLLDGRFGLYIGRNVSVSEGVMLLTAEHDPQSPSFDLCGAPILVGDHVFLGARAIVLPGVHLAEGSVVAAGAVVTRDVPAYAIVAGVPARTIGQRTSELDYELAYAKFLG